LVPDARNVITSNAGWDTVQHAVMLQEIVQEIKSFGVRVSIFVNPVLSIIEGAAKTGTDRIELFTEPYAHEFHLNKEIAVKPYIECSRLAHELGMGINAGHDLDLNNLKFLKTALPYLDEVSIGHALIADALYFGLENTIQLYLRQLR
jgi:pyridoxine 5-phosphate synthase